MDEEEGGAQAPDPGHGHHLGIEDVSDGKQRQQWGTGGLWKPG